MKRFSGLQVQVSFQYSGDLKNNYGGSMEFFSLNYFYFTINLNENQLHKRKCKNVDVHFCSVCYYLQLYSINKCTAYTLVK